ncbi:MAG: hypothetical protein GF383_09005 [Candidatus Lokiarchaeota archaeon]|nr:hypothetical protein [Candidatus Lokiarchaeota archaeon]MBD3340573.1 hypothetical protein [Candidatus Lokiarchaeota archaeon]
MEIIKYLGDKLANRIHISPPAARGLLKLAIKDELGPFIKFEHINYKDLSESIKNSFKKRLTNLKVADYEAITEYMLNELTLNQSLIVMGGVFS